MPRKTRLALVGAALAVASTGVAVNLAGVAHAAAAVTIASGPFNNGDSITVSGSGFPNRTADPAGIDILECTSSVVTSLQPDASYCDASTVNPLPILTDSSGNFSASFQVSQLSTLGGSNINCDALSGDTCVLWAGPDYNNAFTSNSAYSSTFNMNGPPVFTSPATGHFNNGHNSSVSITTSGLGSPAGTVSESAPSGYTGLPSDLTFAPGSGGSASISGTPSASDVRSAPYTALLTATNSFGSRSEGFSMTVGPAGAACAIATYAIPPATRGQAYGGYQFQTVGTCAGLIKWKATQKPPKGLKVAKTGQMTGTPKAKNVNAGNYPITVEVLQTIKTPHQPTVKNTYTQAFTITLK
jgi:hypothetical protein